MRASPSFNPLFALFIAINGALSVDAPGPGIGEGVLHGLHLGRHLAKLLWLPGELFLNSLQPERDKRFAAVADAGNLRKRKVLSEAKQKDLGGRSFPQAVVGVEGTEKLKYPGREAEALLIGLRRLGRWGLGGGVGGWGWACLRGGSNREEKGAACRIARDEGF